jgi:integrase
MAKRELTQIEVKNLKHPNDKKVPVRYAVGGVAGLHVQITANQSKSWLLRTTVAGKQREFGLGGFPEIGLSEARVRARELREQVRQGVDPKAAKLNAKQAILEQQREAERKTFTFAVAVEEYLSMKASEFRNVKHQKQWSATLYTYANPVLGDLPIEDITVQHVLQVLQPIWATKNETASRLRGRIESVLAWATVYGYRSGDNPARWKGNLKEALPRVKRCVDHFPALQYQDAARWFSLLRRREGMGSRALEFLALTCVRSANVRGATWDEIDLNKGLWIIPAQRMKMDSEHRVPLPTAALELLNALPRLQGNPLVFPAPRGGELSDMTLSATMKRIHEADVLAGGDGFVDGRNKRPAVPHGLRSTFRDWVAETTRFDHAMAELALAHKISNSVEAAYRRGDMIEKRRGLMDAWADHLTGAETTSAEVIQFG